MEAVFMNLSDTPKELFKKCSQLQEFRWIHGSCDFSKEFLTKNNKLKTFVYVQSKKTCKNGTNIHEKVCFVFVARIYRVDGFVVFS